VADGRCTLDLSEAGPTTCLCTGRPGCAWREAEPVCVDCGNRDCLGDCGAWCCGGDTCIGACGGQAVETVDVAGGVL
jgi:hypothetical protein